MVQEHYIILFDDGSLRELTLACVDSIKQNVNCTIILFAPYSIEGIQHRDLDISRWQGRRMTCRVETVRNLDLPNMSKVIISDVDTTYYTDPFPVFQESDDIVYTTRHYASHTPVNAGIWGFIKKSTADAAIDFIIEQMRHPTWPAYLEYRATLASRALRQDSDWFTHQDILCAIHIYLNKLPIDSQFRDIGYRYNYCPESGFGMPTGKLEDFLDSVERDKPIIVHYKEFANSNP